MKYRVTITLSAGWPGGTDITETKEFDTHEQAVAFKELVESLHAEVFVSGTIEPVESSEA